MAFADFPYPAVLEKFGLTQRVLPDLFAGVRPVAPSPRLVSSLESGRRLAAANDNEFANAMFLVAPVFSDVWAASAGDASLYLGSEFTADPGAGLTGCCNVILTRGPQRNVVSAPVVVIAEVIGDAPENGLGRCVAAMVGAQRFNACHGTVVPSIYGCSTTGSHWKFLRLTGSVLELDFKEYAIEEVENILGVLSHMVGPLPAVPLAA